MKSNLLFSIMLASLLSVFGYAQDVSYQTKLFRTHIQTFLREEGFAPTLDDDGSIVFAKEGEKYWIDVLGDDPYYVSFHRAGLSASTASEIAVLKAVNDVNTNIRAIKCCYLDDFISMSIESYCYVSEDFKYVFYKYLNILELAEDLLKDAYSKYEDLDTSNNETNRNSGSENRSYAYSSSNSTAGKSSNALYINGPILDTTYHKWWASKIALSPYSTTVYKIVVPKIANTYVCSTGDEYIEDCDTGKKYYIQSSSLGINPQKTILHGKEHRTFYDTYPALPSSVRRINIRDSNGYYVRNFQIR